MSLSGFCSTEETKVIDSRLVSDGYQVRRRRECGNCHERFTTFETAELVVPKIIKMMGHASRLTKINCVAVFNMR